MFDIRVFNALATQTSIKIGQISLNVTTPSPTMIAPTFSAIAETPGINERALIVWFQSSDHATMPNLILAQKDLDDVVAYILSLRAQK